ncbi:MAG: PIG-L family deacetylase [Propionibacteriaceae bacterium]|nr:PIG-L family deacetylase [Propionibacteriaceae bacterium]
MRYVFLHAHPDDETLSTGAIIACLVAQGHECQVVTATRGERGEWLPGSLSDGVDLVATREGERARALDSLGALDGGWLGSGLARAGGRPDRMYRDSGMRWVTPTLAGPSPDAGADSLCLADLAEVVEDVAACVRGLAGDVLVSYGPDGGYGHPDHIRCHEAARLAASACAVPFAQIVTDPAAADQWLDAADRLRALTAAHEAYRTQFRVQDHGVVHVGGQWVPMVTAAGLAVRS